MREAGWGLIGLGLFVLVGAFLFVDVSREIGYIPGASDYLPRMPRAVANVHAMHIQSLVFHAGLAAFLAGVICIAAATVDDTMRRNDAPREAAAFSARPADTDEDIAAPEPTASEPDVPTGGWAAVAVVTLVIVAIIVMLVASENSGRPSTGAVSNDVLMNGAGNETLENLVAAAENELDAAR